MDITQTSATGPFNPANEFAYEVYSRGNGPAMLMMHGMLSSRLQWKHNKAALSGMVDPVLVEFWGHGQSPVPDDPGRYTVDAMVASIDRVREHVGAQQIVLCTQSFGAGLGLHYCLQHPDRVIAHIFTNSISALMVPDTPDAIADRDKRLALIRDMGRAGLEKMPFHPVHARRLDPAVREVLIDAANQVSPEAFLLLTGQTRPNLSVIDRVADITVPTLLVNGRWEKRFQPLRDQVSALMPALQVADIEAGHAVNLEQANQFNEAVLAFLRGLPVFQSAG